jgi:hypothetical protein
MHCCCHLAAVAESVFCHHHRFSRASHNPIHHQQMKRESWLFELLVALVQRRLVSHAHLGHELGEGDNVDFLMTTKH